MYNLMIAVAFVLMILSPCFVAYYNTPAED